MAVSANDRQVGGLHYKSGTLQHWDIMAWYKVPYLEGHLTKYLRHRKKNGLQDVQKMQHFLEKIIECHDEFDYRLSIDPVPLGVIGRFCAEQGYNPSESLIMIYTLRWRTRDQLLEVGKAIQAILDEYHPAK